MTIQLKDKNRTVYDTIALLIVFACVFIFLICFPACTASLNVVSNQGKATDLVDETQSTDPEVSPSLSVPVSAV